MEIVLSRERRKAKRLVTTLLEKKLELATMESCTGGGLANTITSINGAGSVYQGGHVTYSGFTKAHAGVPEEALNGPDGPYSSEVASLMAKMSLRDPFAPLPQNGNAIGVGITGTLEVVDRFYPHIQPGTVWVGVYKDSQTTVYQFNLRRRSRANMKNEAVRKTLDIITATIDPTKKLSRRIQRVA